MAMKATRLLLFVPALFLLCPQVGFPCVVPNPEAIFAYSVHPDFPLEDFMQGRLGVLQPSFKRTFLFVSYRHMTGRSLNLIEQQAMLNVWEEFVKGSWGLGENSAVNAWLAMRKTVRGVDPPPPISPYKPDRKGYFSYLNCPDAAFETAAKTLEQRIKSFGIGSLQVRDWVSGQDAVFANCGGDVLIPDQVKPGGDRMAVADRTYQIAAAHFYAGEFDKAESLFRRIAQDPSSPWSRIAPYLTARALIRDATLSTGADEQGESKLKKAEEELQKILLDNSLEEFHRTASGLLGLVRFRLYPEQRLSELARKIVRTGSGETLKQDFWDYTLLYSKFEDSNPPALPKLAVQDDLTDWLFAFRTQDDSTLDHSLKRWEETRSLPWLVAVMTKIGPLHPKLEEVLKSAETIPQGSSVFPTIRYHKIRLLIESGRREEARVLLDGFLAKNRDRLGPSTLNLFLSSRMRLAENMSEFLRYAQRIPAGICFTMGGEFNEGSEMPLRFEDYPHLKPFMDGRTLVDADSVRLFNMKIPLNLLKEAVLGKELPAHLRRDLAIAAWVRSVLLNRHDTGMELVAVLRDVAPELKPYLQTYVDAKTPEERKFVAAFTILKFPGMRPYINGGVERLTPFDKIDDFRDNWWGSLEMDDRIDDFQESAETISFLQEKGKREADEEWKSLSAVGAAPGYLAREVIRWAKIRPGDRRVPESLHYAVRSTRYGFSDRETEKYSKAAFTLLHKQYPKSEWTKKTPYWFR